MFREATAEDADTIADIHVLSWRDAYAAILDPDYLAGPIEDDRRSVWSARMASPGDGQKVILAVDDDQIQGFVCVFANCEPEWGALVDNLHVLPSARGRGIGARLLGCAAAWLERAHPGSGLYLWVFEANEGARRFYERLGGQLAGSDIADGPGAAGRPILRIAWPDPALLVRLRAGQIARWDRRSDEA